MQTSYPFDIGSGATIDAAQWRAMAKRWRGSGVNKGDQNGLAVAAGTGLQTTVASGSGFVQGHFYNNSASLPLAHDAADPTFGRLDLVCLELDLTDLNAPLVEAVVVKGTPSGSPVIPGMTQSSTIYQIPLAQVLIPALATSVSTITDWRPWAGYRPRIVDGAGGGTASTASTSYVDMMTMGVTFYSDGGDIDLSFSGTANVNTVGGNLDIGASLDGAAEVYLGTIRAAGVSYEMQFSARHLFTSVSAGFHALKMRMKVGNGAHTGSVSNSRRMLWAEVL